MRRVLPALVVLSWSWAVLVAVTGGFDLRPFGLPLRSTNPDRAVYATAILTAAYVYFYRDHARRSAQALATWEPAAALLERSALLIVVALSLGMILVGIRQGSLVAEASDAWGYLSQADLWLARDLVVEQPFTAGMPWPQADLTFSPLGYRPAVHPGAIVPTYPPGLPVLMAAAKAVAGVCGPFLIAPMLGGLTVWLTYLLGVRLSSRLVGLAGAALLVTSPIFVFMVLSPMSDVPATAFFTLGLVLALSSWRSRAFWTGAAVSMAIFIRPNLVLVGAVFLAFIVMRAQPLDGEQARGARLRALLWFSLGGAPLVLVVAALNATLYGAPWSGGHGSVGDLYSWRFVWRNLIDYPRWMWATETPLIALAVGPVDRVEAQWRTPLDAGLPRVVCCGRLGVVSLLPAVRPLAVSAVSAAGNSGATCAGGVRLGDVCRPHGWGRGAHGGRAARGYRCAFDAGWIHPRRSTARPLAGRRPVYECWRVCPSPAAVERASS